MTINKYENKVLVIGSPRSGTTWISEVINANNQFRVLFEPFHYIKVPEWKADIERPVYLLNDDFKLISDAEEIINGNVKGDWVDKEYVNKSNFGSKNILIKDVRVNGFAGVLKKHLPDIKIVLVVRNPIDVTISHRQKRWTLDLDDTYLKQENVIKIFGKDSIDIFKKANGQNQQSFVIWAIETIVPILQLDTAQNHSVFKESLDIDPLGNFKKIAEFLGIDFSKEMKEQIHVLSKTTSRNKNPSLQRRLEKYRTRITKNDVRFLNQLLDVTGLGNLYDGKMPIPNSPLNYQRHLRGQYSVF